MPDHGAHRSGTGGLDDRAAVNPGRTKVLIQTLAVGIQAGQVDEIDLMEITQLQFSLHLQRVMLGQHAHHVGTEQQFTIRAARYLFDFSQAKVMLLGNQ
ncbi:hypothetical protein D3C75_1114110 [compost metagenome]